MSGYGDLFLGIDCGTQGTKALLLDAHSGRVLGQGAATHRLIEGPNGRREQEPSEWLAALAQSCRAVLDKAGVDGHEVRGIGVSGQQHGLVLLDERGDVLRPAKLWCDTESQAENQRLLDYLGGVEGSLRRLGVALAPGYTLSKLLWTRERHPHVFERIAHILLPHDYLNFWLTGCCCSEHGDASGTGYFDVRGRTWDVELLRHIDSTGRLAASVPALLTADEPVGTLRPEVARQLGLSDDVLVSSGGGDNMMGAIGTGNIQPGILTMSLGTSGTLYAWTDRPRIGSRPEIASFCASSGGWLSLICTMNLTNANALVRELLNIDLDSFSQLAAQAPIGAEGLTLLPFFNGERVPPLPEASASLLGMTSANMTRANLCRAVLEGTTFGLRRGLDLLRENGIRSDNIRLIGGGAKSAVWRQLIADSMDMPVIGAEQNEAAALGAAIQAAWCHARQREPETSLEELCARCVRLDETTATRPLTGNVRAYETAYRRYRRHLKDMYGI